MNKDNLDIISEKAGMQQLLDKFFDGLTTVDEERRLYAYFSSAELPEELECYRPLFGWLDAGMPEIENKPRSSRYIWAFVTSVAAMLAIVVTLGVDFMRTSGDQYAMYEGSYVMRGGNKITDLRTIMPDIRQAESQADRSLASQPLASVPDGVMDARMRAVFDELVSR